MKKRLWCLILSLVLALQPLAYVQAEETDSLEVQELVKKESFNTGKHVNPVYSDYLKKGDLSSVERKDFPTYYSESRDLEFETERENVLYDIRYNMINRVEQFSVFYASTTEVISDDDFTIMVEDLLWEALEETDDPKGGDYLRWHFGGYGCEGYIYETPEFDGYYYYEIIYGMTYLSTLEQENQVNTKVRNVVNELKLNYSNISDYEKTSKIYDYICKNVEYDWEHYEDETYDTQFTAYGALIDGKAVCQGFSTLFYRLLEEAKVDARVVVSTEDEAHAWNISEIDGVYYYSDSTWDEDKTDYEYFLQGKEAFLEEHTPDPVWADFLKDYNISDVEYFCPENCEHEWNEEYTVDKEPTCQRKGKESIYCSLCDVQKEGSEREISIIPHELKYCPYTEATCTSDGCKESYYCPMCHKTFEDAEAQVELEGGNIIFQLPHEMTFIEGVEPTCLSTGIRSYYVCSLCNSRYGDKQGLNNLDGYSLEVAALGHSYTSVVTKPTKTEQGYTTHTCVRCGDTYVDSYTDPLPEGEEEAYVYRIYGETRYETSFAIADVYKQKLGVEKLNSVIIANGKNFADALAGSYLAAVKKAPILMTNGKNIADLKEYITKNMYDDGVIYILGGTAAVPQAVENGLNEWDVKRLAGDDRYKTNLAILEEARVSNEDILICTGENYADSLSASATGNPILLVGKSLTAGQKKFLESVEDNEKYILGGTGAVSEALEKQIKEYDDVARIAGASRYETSIEIANTFFRNPESAVLTYGMNYPDGLCGGPIAFTLNAPVILITTNAYLEAQNYIDKNDINSGVVLGGKALITDQIVMNIFDITSDMLIEIKK